MLIPADGAFPNGYTAVTDINGKHSEMLMDFGILRLGKGESFTDSARAAGGERAYLLIRGKAEFRWGESSAVAERSSLQHEMPAVLHLPAGVHAEVTGLSEDAELSVHSTPNAKSFEPRMLFGNDIKKVILGSGKVEEETKRELRIAADDDTAPFSEMVFGEVVNFPGKWSSYPPHHHPHPEIYHYRFEPENGFGYAEEGGQVYRVVQGDTLLVRPNLVHPQTAAPGYAMVYIWMMPHLRGNRFGKDTRQFEPEHKWVME